MQKHKDKGFILLDKRYRTMLRLFVKATGYTIAEAHAILRPMMLDALGTYLDSVVEGKE